MLAIPRGSKTSDCLLRGLIADSRLAGLGKLDELLLSGVDGLEDNISTCSQGVQQGPV
jgi:hypothetical protein